MTTINGTTMGSTAQMALGATTSKAATRGLILLALLLIIPAAGATQEETPRIQIAILIDTSGSMSGLINQAKTQLWKVVNEFATAERDGLRPELEVALYEYGKSSLSGEEGYIRMILPLTTDLDAVSEELFVLTTNGGDEYCGWVIQDAVTDLAWSRSHNDLKAIFIAGNEPFTQGGVDFRESCRASIARGIVVNTIHCGSYEDGRSGLWEEGARLADGKYMNIDHDRDLVHIDAPQDAEIARLGAELNTTYVPYGASGDASASRQEAQDTNAMAAAPAAAAQRTLFKASVHYKNAEWDLVDAVKGGQIDLEELKDLDDEALPEELREMTPEERLACIEENSRKRTAIQDEITRLNEERKQYVAEKMRELGEDGTSTLDEAMITAIREQAEARKFVFK
ncbi:MAG: VWA domain-containing protein [Candidatus Eisenbacteria sp.]|nr:VWA domain-containing protein [Candidatus Eisenbacteria bacterium]